MARVQELEHLKIPLEDIKLATNNFSKHNFIAKGGFGRVYKGQLSHPTTSSEAGTTVAVKRLDTKMGQGDREFLMEIVMLASYKHDNLVSLIGFCDESHEKILIYKHEVHGSLDKHLATMDITWEQRLRICLGAAHGLDYLHWGVGEGHRVIHRDIKSSNILLDAKWEAKISDFGLCKLGPTGQQYSLVATNVAGTYGYLDPQYFNTGILTKESDVYSFGVVMLEVLCGRLAHMPEYQDVRSSLIALVKLRYEEGKLDEIIIPDLLKQMNPYSLETFLKITFQCVDEDRRQRPAMKLIINELEVALQLQIGPSKVVHTLYGSSKGGYSWVFLPKINHKIKKITIDHADVIFSITFTTEDLNGSLHSSPRFGGGNGPSNCNLSEINFDADEEIIGISGTIGPYRPVHVRDLISSMYIKTNKNNYGLFGKCTASEFSESWDMGLFAGFHGRCGYYLDAIGCCLKNEKALKD